jgi:hypothetical protein
LAEFGEEAVKFYAHANQREDGGVPITDWYCLPKHEFEVFVKLLQKMDQKIEDLRRYQEFAARCL